MPIIAWTWSDKSDGVNKKSHTVPLQTQAASKLCYLQGDFENTASYMCAESCKLDHPNSSTSIATAMDSTLVCAREVAVVTQCCTYGNNPVRASAFAAKALLTSTSVSLFVARPAEMEMRVWILSGRVTTSYPKPCVYYIFIPQTIESYPITQKRGMIR